MAQQNSGTTGNSATSGTAEHRTQPVPEIVAQAINQARKSATSGTLFSKNGWRIEVTGKGKYFNYRKGRGENRKGSYGGKFGKLSPKRQAEYYQNIHTHAR